mmetsp:Transcript_83616/g.167468  ORF Transcript_83616/g.167468 Transcript_83616/m.167468 type:complete len:227 (+) Transcript_83616:815-1495(+)
MREGWRRFRPRGHEQLLHESHHVEHKLTGQYPLRAAPVELNGQGLRPCPCPSHQLRGGTRSKRAAQHAPKLHVAQSPALRRVGGGQHPARHGRVPRAHNVARHVKRRPHAHAPRPAALPRRRVAPNVLQAHLEGPRVPHHALHPAQHARRVQDLAVAEGAVRGDGQGEGARLVQHAAPAKRVALPVAPKRQELLQQRRPLLCSQALRRLQALLGLLLRFELYHQLG